jgi:hypothetical protein
MTTFATRVRIDKRTVGLRYADSLAVRLGSKATLNLCVKGDLR